MNFFTWLTTKRKSISTMSATELRSEEMLLENDRNQMLGKVQKLAGEKQKIIDKGAKEKSPEVRRAFAQQYDLLHTEQMMLNRHLSIRTKELLTVSRLRMARETAERAGARGTGRGLIRAGDLGAIERLIENDKITAEMYQERLDEILRLGLEGDEASSTISPAAGELLKVWDAMDAGLIKDSGEAFDEAERRVRERQSAAE